MLSIEYNENPDKNWNNRLLNSEMSTLYQTQEYGNYFEELGQKPIFLKFIDSKDNIVGQLLALSSFQFSKKTGLKKLGKFLPKIKKEIIKWVYGPIIFNDDYTNEIYSLLNDFLNSKNCYVKGSTSPFSKYKFTQSGLNSKPWCTFLINLHQDKDVIFSHLHKHSGQKNIERSIERGVTIHEIDKNSLKDYTDLINQKKISLNQEATSYETRLKYFEKMSKVGYKGFLAKKNEIPIGGLFFSYFNKYIIEGGVARSKLDFKEKLYSQDLIKWKIIEWGVENKMDWYDFAGANPHPLNSKEEGILRYKKKWGGQQFDYYIISNLKTK